MHPKLAALIAYRDGELEEAQARRITAHLQQCSQCHQRSELGIWRLDRLAERPRHTPAAREAAVQRGDCLARVRALRSSQAAITPSLTALLVGRRAASDAGEPLAANRG